MSRNRILPWVEPARHDLVLERRDIIKSAAFMAGGCFAAAVSTTAVYADTAEAENSSDRYSTPSVIARDESAVVATSAGRVSGYVRKGIFTFKGIP
jgi:hypothetical protein